LPIAPRPGNGPMNDEQTKAARKALKRAIDAAGGQSSLARMLGIKQPAVSQWTVAPLDRCLTIESLTGVSRFELRPDLEVPE